MQSSPQTRGTLLFRDKVGSWLVDLLAPVPYYAESDKEAEADGGIEE